MAASRSEHSSLTYIVPGAEMNPQSKLLVCSAPTPGDQDQLPQEDRLLCAPETTLEKRPGQEEGTLTIWLLYQYSDDPFNTTQNFFHLLLRKVPFSFFLYSQPWQSAWPRSLHDILLRLMVKKPATVIQTGKCDPNSGDKTKGSC